MVKSHGIVLPKPTNLELDSCHCKVCDLTYKYKKNLVVHLRNVHNIALPSRFDGVPNTIDKNNYCAPCDRTFSDRQHYSVHLVAAYLEKEPEVYEGIDCDLPSRLDIKFNRFCAHCRKKFLSKTLCRMHMDKIHGIKLPNVDDQDINYPNNYCTSCDKTYCRKQNYRRHLFRSHNQHLPIAPSGRSIVKNITPAMDHINKYCNACNRKYKSLQYYRRHMSKFHSIKFSSVNKIATRVYPNEIPAIDEVGKYCTVCDFKYTNRYLFKNHLCKVPGIVLPGKKFKDGRIIAVLRPARTINIIIVHCVIKFTQIDPSF